MADEPKKPLGEKNDIQDLIALMQQNNKSQGEIEKDQRNTRRHLLELKNMTKTLSSLQERTAFGFENFQEMIDSNNLQGQEDSRERTTLFQEIRDELRNLPKDTAEASSEESRKGRGGFGKLGGILAGLGIASVGIGVGIAAVFYTAPQLIKAFEKMDAAKVAQNVETLVGINQMVEDKGGNLLLDGGSLALAMTGIGVGLLALGIGSAANAGVDKFLEDGWAEKVVDNVTTLLSISQLQGGSLNFLGQGGGFALAMSGIGLGLAAFGIGKVADGTATAINKFAAGDNFAERIKKEVETLLSIDMSKADGNKTQFIATMSSLGLGLAAFSVGKAGAGVAEGVNFFARGDNFADDIKKEVETLLEIPNLPGVGGDTAGFLAVMTGISAGLGAFAVTKGASGVAEFLNLGGNFATGIKEETDVLLTIGEGADEERSRKAAKALAHLSGGLALFAGSKGIGAFTTLGSSIVDFFTGNKNPIDQALLLGENSDKVQSGADAFMTFADALTKFTNVSLDFDAEKLAEELYEASKVLELALIGGSEGFIFKEEFVGLNNLGGDIDRAVININKLKDALSLDIEGGPTMTIPSKMDGLVVNTMSVENAILKMEGQDTAGVNTNVIRGGDQVRGGDSYIFNTPSANDSITEGLANR